MVTSALPANFTFFSFFADLRTGVFKSGRFNRGERRNADSGDTALNIEAAAPTDATPPVVAPPKGSPAAPISVSAAPLTSSLAFVAAVDLFVAVALAPELLFDATLRRFGEAEDGDEAEELDRGEIEAWDSGACCCVWATPPAPPPSPLLSVLVPSWTSLARVRFTPRPISVRPSDETKALFFPDSVNVARVQPQR